MEELRKFLKEKGYNLSEKVSFKCPNGGAIGVYIEDKLHRPANSLEEAMLLKIIDLEKKLNK